MADVKFPFGAVNTAIAMTATGAQAITIKNGMTRIDGVTVEATGNRTLDITADSELVEGAMIIVTNKSNGTETLTFGTLITAAVITGAAGKINSQAFYYDGSGFTPFGLQTQID